MGELLRFAPAVGRGGQGNPPEDLPLLPEEANVRNTPRLSGDPDTRQRSAHGGEVARVAPADESAEILLQHQSVARGTAPHGRGDARATVVHHASGDRSWFHVQKTRRPADTASRRLQSADHHRGGHEEHPRLSED
ncbi:hypothetical protein A2640_02935 [Candidatus Nomurabacteria bacterium RIFCSPHIGHO2_01_FULL_36_23]|nr:MAG: hypothetical protein A2640_02935 [Candidatus Nomurabacteria bacterium RIFCSPHIGHO2_01_FULL_36_23]